jgi:hypothetical protein
MSAGHEKSTSFTCGNSLDVTTCSKGRISQGVEPTSNFKKVGDDMTDEVDVSQLGENPKSEVEVTDNELTDEQKDALETEVDEEVEFDKDKKYDHVFLAKKVSSGKKVRHSSRSFTLHGVRFPFRRSVPLPDSFVEKVGLRNPNTFEAVSRSLRENYGLAVIVRGTGEEIVNKEIPGEE